MMLQRHCLMEANVVYDYNIYTMLALGIRNINESIVSKNLPE